MLDEPWSNSWPSAKKTQWIWEKYAQKMIGELGTYDNVFFVYKDERSYEDEPWKDNMAGHMLSFFRRRGSFLLTDWDRSRDEVDVVMVATHAVEKNKLAVKGFVKEPARPVLLLESQPYTLGDRSVRISMWTFAVGGGHFLFHDDTRQGTARTGIMGYDPNVVGGVKPLLTYDWLGYLSRFFNHYVSELDSMAPHNELVTAGNAYCLANPGTAYVCYLCAGDRITLDLSSLSGTASVEWYNPRTGELSETTNLSKGEAGALSFTAPDDDDWTLLVRKQ